MIRAHYYCSQPALYQVSRHIIRSFSKHMEEFSTFKARYNPAFINKLEEALIAAEELPDYTTRGKQAEDTFTELNAAFKECTLLWQRLKRYIQSAYPATEHQMRLEQAGSLYYKKANLKHWEAARNLLIAAQNFLGKQHSTLTSNDNMPATFRSTFMAAHVNFSRLMLMFRQSEEKIKVDTLHKLKANNTLFALITEICLDGQSIFRQQPGIKSEFTFAKVLKTVSTPKKKSKALRNLPIDLEGPSSKSELQSPAEGSKGQF